MGTRFIFPSLAESNIRYVVYSASFDHNCNGGGISDYLTAFDTYGHDDVQHTPEWKPQPDRIVDVLQSLALHIASLEGERRDEFIKGCTWLWPMDQDISRERVEFAAALRYKDDAKSFHRRYSLESMSISTSESKRHDKRFDEVTSFHDGSFAATMGVLHNYDACHGLMRLLARCKYVIEIIDRHTLWDVSHWLKWSDEQARDVWEAFRVVDSFLQGWRTTDHAKRSADCLRNNMRINSEVDAPAEAVA